MELIDPDDGVVIKSAPTRRHYCLAVLPIIVAVVSGLLLWLWPAQQYDVSPLYRGTLTPVVPTVIASVVQGQPVGGESYWESFQLQPGWHLAQNGNRYMLVATVTNGADTPDIALILVTIRVAERSADVLLCKALLDPGETKAVSCIDTNHAPFTSRWARITLSAV